MRPPDFFDLADGLIDQHEMNTVPPPDVAQRLQDFHALEHSRFIHHEEPAGRGIVGLRQHPHGQNNC